jgi:hypothetical protein
MNQGMAYVLDTDASLWFLQTDKVPFDTRSPVDDNIAAFQAPDTDQVFALGTDGNLWFTPAPFGPPIPNPKRQQVDSHVAL